MIEVWYIQQFVQTRYIYIYIAPAKFTYKISLFQAKRSQRKYEDLIYHYTGGGHLLGTQMSNNGSKRKKDKS